MTLQPVLHRKLNACFKPKICLLHKSSATKRHNFRITEKKVFGSGFDFYVVFLDTS